MPPLTCSLKPPLSRCGMPVANSRFSRPRATSPSASVLTLPCSRVRCAAVPPPRRLEGVADAEEDLGPLADARRTPAEERLVRGRDGGIDFLDRGEVDLAR